MVLKKVLEVFTIIKFISQWSLGFYSDNKELGSPHSDEFLQIIALLSQFDLFLAEDLARYRNAKRGNPSYLSLSICKKCITLMGSKVLSGIVHELKEMKYFSVSADSRPDISHIWSVNGYCPLRYFKRSDKKKGLLSLFQLRGLLEKAVQIYIYLFWKAWISIPVLIKNTLKIILATCLDVVQANIYNITLPHAVFCSNSIRVQSTEFSRKTIYFFKMCTLPMGYPDGKCSIKMGFLWKRKKKEGRGVVAK